MNKVHFKLFFTNGLGQGTFFYIINHPIKLLQKDTPIPISHKTSLLEKLATFTLAMSKINCK